MNNYQGNELDLFAKAVNWKKYFSSQINPYIKENILEVGAGQGSTTEAFAELMPNRNWHCLEPDETLCKDILQLKQKNNLLKNIKITNGTIDSVKKSKFDTIIYIDVIEHIDNPQKELEKAAALLSKKGCLIILVPAHNFLYSPFDKSIGHKTRYNKNSLNSIIPGSLNLTKMSYLDSAGLLASTMNKLILKQNIPTLNQILFWDKYLVRTSKFLDALLFSSIGKSLLGIWEKV